MNEDKAREIKGQTARDLRRAGMDGARAERVAAENVKHVDNKSNGRPVPERFRPITDSRTRR